MKKIISLILGLSMVLSLGSVAFAEAQNNNLTLVYSNLPTYEITIPASVDFGSGGNAEIAIEVDNSSLADCSHA